MRFCLCLLLISTTAGAQQSVIDSLTARLQRATHDRERVDLFNQLAFSYHDFSLPRSIELAEEAIRIAKQSQLATGEAMGYNNLGIVAAIQGDSHQGLEYFLRALTIYDSIGDKPAAARLLNNIAGIHLQEHNYEKAVHYSHQSLEMLKDTQHWTAMGNAHMSLGLIYQQTIKGDKALSMVDAAVVCFERDRRFDKVAEANVLKAELLVSRGDKAQARRICLDAMTSLNKHDFPVRYAELLQVVATIDDQEGAYDVAIDRLQEAQRLAQHVASRPSQIKTLGLLYEVYAHKQKADSALYYFERYKQLNHEWFDLERARQVAVLESLYHSEKVDKQLAISRQQLQVQKVFLAVALVVIVSVSFGAYSFFRLYRRKKKLSRRLEESNHEIAQQAEYLHDLNRKLEQINTNLEAEVMVRTQRITQQNTRLMELAFFAAHNLRAPLARVLGLIQLMQMETWANDSSGLLQRLDQSAEELDVIVKDIGKRIEENIDF
jgi:tetratricopeptide (TPR) repeat protein